MFPDSLLDMYWVFILSFILSRETYDFAGKRFALFLLQLFCKKKEEWIQYTQDIQYIFDTLCIFTNLGLPASE